MPKLLIHKRLLNNIANMARQYLSSNRSYRISEITSAVLAYDAESAIKQDPIIRGMISQIWSRNFNSLYLNESTDKVLNIPDGFFYSYSFSAINSIISFPNCSYIGEIAFAACHGLYSVDFKACQFIDSDAFMGCFDLTSMSFPACKKIMPGAFTGCSLIYDIDFPECESIGINAFSECLLLKKIIMPKLKSVVYNVFSERPFLQTVSLDNCLFLSDYAFTNCERLSTIHIPECKYIGKFAFQSCQGLSHIELNSCEFIDNFAFQHCTTLSSIMMLNNKVPYIQGENIFTDTPFDLNYSGSIIAKMYVKKSLHSQYIRRMSSIMNDETIVVYD